MNRNLSLSINKPCPEKFDGFQPTAAGGFCNACRKEVIDFTKMSDLDILRHFKNEQKNTCGYFRKSQLKTYSEIVPSKRKQHFNALGAGLMSFSLLSLLSINDSHAQHSKQSTEIHAPQKESSNKQNAASEITSGEHIVKGIVVDEDNIPLPGASVVLKGTTIGTHTDFDGNFTFPQPLKAGDILLFSYIGLKTQKLTISEDDPNILTIRMKFDYCDLVVLGEVTVDHIYASKPSFWQKLKGFFR